MSAYMCPVCTLEIPRDLALFLDHTNQHIIDAIKKQHPQWVTSDGICRKCVEYYQSQFPKMKRH